jgi:hypothetical protein
MIIHSYVISMWDDCDVLPDALDSLAHFSDHIYVVDGGIEGGTLCHHPRYETPLAESTFGKLLGDSNFGDRTLITTWNNVPLTLWENPFLDPGNQRNWTLKKMEKEPNQPNWICWIDSDEVTSRQFIDGLRPYLEALNPFVTNVCPKWLNLVQDEHHCVPHMSNWLAHGRLHQPRTVYYNSGWHEHQNYDGERDHWDVRIIHARALYRRRLWIQRGHPMVAGRDNPLWADAKIEAIPFGVSWANLHWPKDEVIIPFDMDIRDFDGGKYA